MGSRDLYRRDFHGGKMMDKGRRGDTGCWSASTWVLAVVAVGIIGSGGYYLNWYIGETARLTLRLESLQINSNLLEKRIQDDAATSSTIAEDQQRSLSICDGKLRELESNLKRAKADLEQTGSQLHKSQAQLTALTADQATCKAAWTKCKEQEQDAATKISTCTAELNAASDEVSSCKEQQRKESDAAAACRMSLEDATANLEAAPAKLQLCQGNLQSQVEQVTASQAELQSATQKVAELEAQVSALMKRQASAAGQQETAILEGLLAAKSSEVDPTTNLEHTIQVLQEPIEGEEAGADSTSVEAMKTALVAAQWNSDCPETPLTQEAAVPCEELDEETSYDFVDSKAKHLRAGCESRCLYSQGHPLSIAYFWNPDEFCYDKVGRDHQCLASGSEHDDFLKWMVQVAAADVVAGEEGAVVEVEQPEAADELPTTLQRDNPEEEDKDKLEEEEALGVDEDTLDEVAAFGSVDPNAGPTDNNVEGWDKEPEDRPEAPEELPAELQRDDPDAEDSRQVEKEEALGVDEDTLDEVAAFGTVDENAGPVDNVEGWDQDAEDRADPIEEPANDPQEAEEAAVQAHNQPGLGVDEETLDEVAAFGKAETNAGPVEVDGWDQEAEDVLEEKSSANERQSKSPRSREEEPKQPQIRRTSSKSRKEEPEQRQSHSKGPKIIMPETDKRSRRSKRLFGSHRGEAK
mmetsp:Transcript_21529/g.59835  ORF Transcript_21529/g.59835 Transcript_21529/m.59835 type:complete len:694 (-) Transcript_21529:304-2385(-)